MRQEVGSTISRQNDFLQGMTMKIRFMKRLTVEDLEKNFVADGGRVIFNSCDQVQMKLTQLELNSVRLLTTTECIGRFTVPKDKVNNGVPSFTTLGVRRGSGGGGEGLRALPTFHVFVGKWQE